MPSTTQACCDGVKGVFRVAGWAVKLHAAPRWTLNSLRGAVTDRPLWQETGVVVGNKVTKDTTIREGHSEVLHLHTHRQHASETTWTSKTSEDFNRL